MSISFQLREQVQACYDWHSFNLKVLGNTFRVKDPLYAAFDYLIITSWNIITALFKLNVYPLFFK